jgi:iron complex outermembrane receptor protein
MTYSTRDVPAYEVPLTIDSVNGLVGRVSGQNPFNPFGEDVGVRYRYQDTGVFRIFDQSYLRSVVGVKRDGKRTSWEMSVWQNKDRSTVNGSFVFDDAAVSAALSSSDPATALNPFVGDGTAPGSRELIASLATPLSAEYVTISRGFTGNLRGVLTELPAGQLTGLAGFDYSQNVFETTDPTFGQYVALPNGRSSSRAAFAEVRLPILAGKSQDTGPSLVTTGAFRREWSDRFEGHGDSSTLGIEWKPWQKLNVRASYSTAFKPLLNYNALGPEMLVGGGAFDPVTQEDVEFQVQQGGGVPDGIKPERSTSKTVGFNYRITDDWNFSLNIWKNHLQDRIAAVSTDFFMENEQYFPGRVIRDPVSLRILQVDQRRVNIFSTDVTGADVTFEGVANTPIGSWYNNLSGSYAYKYDEQVVPGAPTVDNVGVLRSGGWAPKWKIVYRSDLQFHQLVSANFAARYVSKYRDRTAYSIGERAGEYPELGGFWTVDIGLDLDMGNAMGITDGFFKEARLKLGVRNVTNHSLDFCASCTYWGYDASQYDVLGRAYQAEIRASF